MAAAGTLPAPGGAQAQPRARQAGLVPQAAARGPVRPKERPAVPGGPLAAMLAVREEPRLLVPLPWPCEQPPAHACGDLLRMTPAGALLMASLVEGATVVYSLIHSSDGLDRAGVMLVVRGRRGEEGRWHWAPDGTFREATASATIKR